MRWALLASIPIFPALVNALVNPNRPAWSPDQLGEGEVNFAVVRGWSDPVMWVDARPRKDYEVEHIPSAMLLNEDEWSGLLPDFLERWEPGMRVVVYCSSRQCDASKSVAQRLRTEAAVDTVYVLKGGWEAWIKAGKQF